MIIPDADDANRMALGILDLDGESFQEAEKRLESLSVSITGGDELCHSAALQAALLTAINSAKRCFLGGVTLDIPPETPLLLPWPAQSLNQAAESLLLETRKPEIPSERISIGQHSDNSWNVSATGWKAAVAFGSENTKVPPIEGHDFSLGGILAGALGVHHAFVRAAGIDHTIHWKVDGISLWTPNLPWASAPDGPRLENLPNKIWLLGLGHLGQAYAWTMGLLPYSKPNECEVMLQDYDAVTRANFGTGLLTSRSDVSILKTRMVEKWLQARRFKTRICDRRFDERTHRSSDEPTVAFCGFHDAPSRRLLGNAGFELIVEAGLGSEIADFDQAQLHTFPNATLRPEEIWSASTSSTINKERHLKLGGDAVCGSLDLAGKAVSTSFVGTMASAFSWAEVLRQYHKGSSFAGQSLNMREFAEATFLMDQEQCSSTRIAIRGYTSTK